MNLLASIHVALSQTAPAAQNAQGSGDETQWMVWAIIAFGVAITLLVLEAFVPSGGVLGVLAGLVALAGIIMFFRFDTMWGMVSMAVALLATPFIFAAMLWIWPNTPIGRALTLEDEQKAVNTKEPAAEGQNAITVGVEGQALTDLRPVGTCRLAGHRIDCISYSGVIEKGTPIRVIGVEGSNIKVKPI